MPTVYLSPDPINSTQLIPGGVIPASGGKLFSYLAGSSTKTNVYTTNTGLVAWSNPIVLDSGGNLGGSNEVWIPAGISVKFVLAPSTDTDPPIAPYKTWDNLSGINDPSSILTEWIPGPTPTFVSTTSFTLVGDQTLTFLPNRRIKATVTVGTVYGTIVKSIFTVLTTVTVAMDSVLLDAGLTAIFYALASPKNTSLSEISVANFGVTADGVTNDSVAMQTAINSAASTGTVLKMFPGTINVSTSGLIFKNGVKYQGSGLTSTRIVYFGTSDAIQINNPINGSTPANIYMADFSVICSTRTAGKASIADVGSSFLNIQRVSVKGNAFGIIFDQTEVASICDSQLNLGNTSSDVGIWLVNGADHTGGGSLGFTNRIKIDNNQFNGISGIGILDDGGLAHTISDNNFTFLDTQIRLAFGLGVSITGNEFEHPVSTCIALQQTSLSGGATLATQALDICDNNFTCSNNIASISYGPISVVNQFIHTNYFDNSTSTGNPTSNISSVTNSFGFGNRQNGAGGSGNTVLGNYLGGISGIPIRIGGSVTLGASEAALWNNESPVTKFYIGDGTGFSLEFDKRIGSTTTPLVIFPDSGGINLVASTTALTITNQVVTVGASTATLTNSPHSGNPTLWPRISINGTTFCFPAFATS